MKLQKIEVAARQDDRGKWMPLRFQFQKREWIVEDVGRRWEDDTGLHILVLAGGAQFFELVFFQHEWFLILKKRHFSQVV